MSAVPIPVRVVGVVDAERLIAHATNRTQARIGALRAQLSQLQDKQDCRINRVQTGYLIERLAAEGRHLERLQAEEKRLHRDEVG